MRSKHHILVALIAGLSIAAAVRADESVGDRLQKGVYQEETVGDLAAAIKIYELIVAEEKANRPHVARATYRLGMCYLKKGQKQEAVETFEKLIKDFPKQSQLTERARGALTALGHVSHSHTAGLRLEDVWAYSGLGELDVLAISRDGRYCAFVDKTGGITVRDLKTENDQRVAEKAPKTGMVANWQRASISPDNKWVAYVGRIPDPEARSCLRIVAIDGSGERLLYPNKEKSVIRDLGWSPDSQFVLATLHDTRGERGVLDRVPVRIATVSLADGSIKVLKTLSPEESHDPGPRPQISPDGRYVAYSRVMDEASRQEDVFLIPLSGGPEVHLIENPANDDVLGWMPDGRGLLIRSIRGGDSPAAWLVRLTDGKPAGVPQLVKAGIPPSVEGPVRTPTGSWAFYFKKPGQYKPTSSVYTAVLDPGARKLSGTPIPVSQPTVGKERTLSPDFSRDGKYMAYYVAPAGSRSLQGANYGPGNIIIRSLETGQERKITLSPQFTDGGWWPFLRWAPDGRSILVQGEDAKRRWGNYRVDVHAGKLSPVTLQDPEMKTPHWGPGASNFWITNNPDFVKRESIRHGDWSADGKTIYYKRGHKGLRDDDNRKVKQTLVARSIETGVENVIYRCPDGEVFSLAVSPDGQRVLLAEGAALKVIPAIGGEPREILKLEGPRSDRIGWRIAWTPDSRHLLFVKVVGRNCELWRIAAEGGQAERVAQLPAALGNWVEELRVHPDGRQIAFVVNRRLLPYQTRMVQISPEWAKESCIANLKKIGEAVKRYERDHGALPEHLSSLYPDYLKDPNLLHCLAHDERQGRQIAHDPAMQSSYQYAPSGYWLANSALPVILPDEEMENSRILELRLKYFGGLMGLVECRQHSTNLQLAHSGKIHEAKSWAGEGRGAKGLLTQLRAAMESNPKTWREDYDIPKLASLLEDRTALSDVLQSYIKAHPGDANASAKQALAELQRVRFINRSEDDATETADGQIELRSHFCTLGGEKRSGNRAVGFRFTNIPVPQGARIKRAYVQFEGNAWSTWDNEGLTFHGELSANAASFQDKKNNITSRRKTTASVKCSPKIWDVRSLMCRTSDLAAVIQEIAAQPDWKQGNALALIVSGSSQGEATPWDYNRGRRVAMLYVEVE